MKLIKDVLAQDSSTAITITPSEKGVSNIGSLVTGLIDAAIVIGALAAFTFLVIGGFQWITSGGDKQKTEAAQKHITNAIVGLVIIAAAYAIIRLITNFLGFDIGTLEIKPIE